MWHLQRTAATAVSRCIPSHAASSFIRSPLITASSLLTLTHSHGAHQYHSIQRCRSNHNKGVFNYNTYTYSTTTTAASSIPSSSPSPPPPSSSSSSSSSSSFSSVLSRLFPSSASASSSSLVAMAAAATQSTDTGSNQQIQNAASIEIGNHITPVVFAEPFGFVRIIADSMVIFHYHLNDFFGITWFGTLIICTIIFRSFIIPIQIYQTYIRARITSITPLLTILDQQTAMLKQSLSSKILLSIQKRLKIYKKNNINLLHFFFPVIIQMSVLLTSSWTLRYIVRTDPSIRTEGLGWFIDLSIPDPYYILPTLTIFVLYSGNLLMSRRGDKLREYQQKKLKDVFERMGMPGLENLQPIKPTTTTTAQTTTINTTAAAGASESTNPAGTHSLPTASSSASSAPSPSPESSESTHPLPKFEFSHWYRTGLILFGLPLFSTFFSAGVCVIAITGSLFSTALSAILNHTAVRERLGFIQIENDIKLDGLMQKNAAGQYVPVTLKPAKDDRRLYEPIKPDVPNTPLVIPLSIRQKAQQRFIKKQDGTPVPAITAKTTPPPTTPQQL